MFGVPKYSKALSALAEERGVQVSLNQNLVEVSHADRKAVFETDSGETITKDFDFLHVVPPQGPLNALKARMLSSRSVCYLPTLTDFTLPSPAFFCRTPPSPTSPATSRSTRRRSATPSTRTSLPSATLRRSRRPRRLPRLRRRRPWWWRTSTRRWRAGACSPNTTATVSDASRSPVLRWRDADAWPGWIASCPLLTGYGELMLWVARFSLARRVVRFLS
jgi:hypothetical protein